ncbi:ABC transporter substrate-binding protein [Casimicrobium huifangae]|uniref:ABC transporter substrate-binding protein n=1 Tax=Casimicrobium huifangae TaxID=2591109 RepID=UPI003784343B
MNNRIFRRSCAACIALAFTVLTPLAQAADQAKVLRLSTSTAETSYDNAFASDESSQTITERINEPMLEYHYLARPAKLVPRTLEALPAISDNGATFLCKVQKGVFFADDVAFQDKPRELTAADYAYSLKRLLDPAVKSPWLFLVEGKIIGGDEARAAAAKTGKFDYDTPMPGLEVVDRCTLRIRLKAPDYNFAYLLAMPATGASAREAVERYGLDYGSSPVGTGAYQLLRSEYKRASKTVLVKNPNYRKRVWDWASDAAEDQAMVKAMRGKAVPSIDRIEVYPIEEGQASWLAFLSGQHDYLPILPASVSNVAKSEGKLKPEYAQQGIRLFPRMKPNVWYTMFNMNDPITGGYTREKIALRRAISLGYPLDEQIRVVFQGDGLAGKGIVPPGVVGHDDKRPRAHVYDPALAKALLDRFGYKDRDGDGYREMPDGSPLIIPYVARTSGIERQLAELWKKSMDAIGIRLAIETMKTPDMRKAARQGQGKMTREGWNADYPDAENFFQMLISATAQPGGENYARFQFKDMDERYEKIHAMPGSPARLQLINQMEDIVKFYAPWIAPWHDVQYYLEQPWVMGYKQHPIGHDAWEFMDIDTAKLPKR